MRSHVPCGYRVCTVGLHGLYDSIRVINAHITVTLPQTDVLSM